MVNTLKLRKGKICGFFKGVRELPQSICVHWVQSEIQRRVWPQQTLSEHEERQDGGQRFPVGWVRALLRIARSAKDTTWLFFVWGTRGSVGPGPDHLLLLRPAGQSW